MANRQVNTNRNLRGRGRGTHETSRNLSGKGRGTRETSRQSGTLDLNTFFGSRNRRRLNPQLNSNYTPDALNGMPSRNEADQIATIISVLFTEPFNISVVPARLGGLIFALAEKPIVKHIYAYEVNLKTMLSNNLSSYGMTNGVTITTNYQQEDASVLLMDLIADPQLDFVQIMATTTFPVYAIRVQSNHAPIRHPGYTCSSENTGNPTTKLLLCTLNSEEVSTSQPLDLGVDPDWLNNLILFLDNILARVSDSPKDRVAYFNEENINYWIQAFTNPTIDPNYNYEVLEMIGDRVMKFAFADYLTQRIPRINESQLSELQNYYLSTLPQAKIARKLGFTAQIRVVGSVKEKILEDVLEAFFGALFRVSENVMGGLGYYNVFMILVTLYQDEPIEQQLEVVKRGRKKTVFLQGLAKLGFNKVGIEGGTEKCNCTCHGSNPDIITNFFQGDEGVVFTITLSRRVLDFFQTHGIRLNPLIGRGTGASKKAAETEAYGEALGILTEQGVTPEWMEEQKEILAFNRPEYLPYLATARARLQREGYVRMTFSNLPSTNSTKECVIQLIGYTEDGTAGVLATSETCDLRTGRIEVLRRYAEGK